MNGSHCRASRRFFIPFGLVLLVLATAPLFAADVVVLGNVLSDNGDHDAYADTNETVNLQITVRNSSGAALSGVTAVLETDAPEIECLIQHAIYVGDLAAGETRLVTAPFVFKVGEVNRTDPYENLRATLRVVMSSDSSGELSVVPAETILDLDLDAAGGSGPGSYFEGFETGSFGSLTTMNLDAGKSSMEASDGYRCQYTDPDWIHSNSYGNTTDCWLAADAVHADMFYWQISDGDPGATVPGRSYTGRYSAYIGEYVASVDDWTSPMGSLEALGSGGPINLGAGSVCETTRTTVCTEDMDCPPGESCVSVAPELSFKHQVDFPDERTTKPGLGRTSHGGAIAVQLADDAGNPVGDWIKIYPYANDYDAPKGDTYVNCQFDPIDDGNTEDDFFDPADPERRLGPSTLCYPEPLFAYIGDTDAPFDPGAIGDASDGPGLEGATGLGTWIESRFNLQQFAGRRIRVRFISSGIKAGTSTTYQDLFYWNPIVGDDGWWVDDILVTDTVTVPVVLTVDDNDNSGLPAAVDGDTDGYCDSDCDDGDPACTVDCSDADSDGQRFCNGDCDESNPVIYLGAEEICDGVSNDCAHPQWPYVDYWTPDTIAEPPHRTNAMVVADLDGDGDPDAATASYNENRIAWYENAAGDGSVWTAHTVSTTAAGAYSIDAADLDGDDDIDLLSGLRGDDTLAWYENTSGDGSAWTRRVINTSANYPDSLMAADVDGDSDLDVLSTARDSNERIRWYENRNGDGSNWMARVITSDIAAFDVFGADIDGDEDLDIVFGEQDVSWWENTQGDGSDWTEHVVLDERRMVVHVADVDGDTDADLLVGDLGYSTLEWFENTAGDGSAWTQHFIADVPVLVALDAADVDGDGDLDALATARDLGEVNWYENAAGDGSTWIVRPITWTLETASSVCTADVDDDGRLDVLAAGDDQVQWYFRRNLELDDDGDGVADCAGDCDDDDLEVWGLPGEVQGLTLLEDRQTLSWSAPADPGGTSLLYDTLRVELPDGFAGAACIESGDGSDTEAVDGDPIDPGTIYYYLVVATSGCGRGSAGCDSDEHDRELCACP